MKLAFVFPGQGSQSVGMLREYADMPEIRATIDEASSALGTDMWTLIDAGPEAALGLTVNTQPVMLAADVAVYRAWRAAGGDAPAIAAGHSLGEYAALVASGVLPFADALRTVRVRAEAMQAAVPEGQGGIAAILGLDTAQVESACRDAANGEIVSPANLNAPGQIVISGHRAAVERAIEGCKALGAKRAILLPMSVPAHCALMAPAGGPLTAALANVAIGPAAFPVLHNVTVAPAQGPDGIRDVLVQQLTHSVRWIETIEALERDHGVTHVVECGPGKVLHGLVRRIVKTASSHTLSGAQAIADTITATRQGA
jgi:[acyl-carrier-protein] S-malonyltransferase